MFLVLHGEVSVGGKSAREGDLVVFSRQGEAIQVAGAPDATVLLMSGEPIDEPVAGQGPFVMNSRAELQKAFEEFQLGRMGQIR